jgi:hypothetical protein
MLEHVGEVLEWRVRSRVDFNLIIVADFHSCSHTRDWIAGSIHPGNYVSLEIPRTL